MWAETSEKSPRARGCETHAERLRATQARKERIKGEGAVVIATAFQGSEEKAALRSSACIKSTHFDCSIAAF